MTPPVPDGPDTELAAANDALSYLDAYARSRDHAHSGDARRWVEAVRAVLARPAAGRDLTAQRMGAAPADDTAAPDAAPRPDWSGAWAELTGYVRAATEPIDPARIDAYMVELKREALRPFREWWEQLAAGQPVRDSQDGGARDGGL